VSTTARGCVFCDWAISGSPSLVYSDENTFVGVDPRQPHQGHVLVMPQRHVPTVYDLDDATAAALMQTTVRVANAVRAALAPDGLSLWQSNGRGAFQEVDHVHMHVMPRWSGDELLRIYPRHIDDLDMSARAAQAALLRQHLT
jgi:histidine triad (HIT) family protein